MSADLLHFSPELSCQTMRNLRDRRGRYLNLSAKQPLIESKGHTFDWKTFRSTLPIGIPLSTHTNTEYSRFTPHLWKETKNGNALQILKLTESQ